MNLCGKHYQRSRKHMTLSSQCVVFDCYKSVHALGWCDMHYRRWYNTGSLELAPKHICFVGECDTSRYAYGMCRIHYRRWAKTGDPGPAGRLRQRNDSTCVVDGCERPSRKRGMCGMHYSRWRISGDAGPAELYHQARQESCNIDGCDESVRARNLCTVHYGRWRYAQGDYPKINKDAAMREYALVHNRLPFWRGSAKQYKCGCGNQAEEWAYMNACPNEKQSQFGAYSLDPDEYAPLCIPCHRRMDRGVRKIKRQLLVLPS